MSGEGRYERVAESQRGRRHGRIVELRKRKKLGVLKIAATVGVGVSVVQAGAQGSGLARLAALTL